MPRARFLGTGFAVPDRVVTNDDLSQLMDTSDEWIRTRTGIQERRWVREGETGAGLAHAASAARARGGGARARRPRRDRLRHLDARSLRSRQRRLPAARCSALGTDPLDRHPEPVQRLRLRAVRWRTRSSAAASTGTCWWSARRCSPRRWTSPRAGGTRPSSSPTARAPRCSGPRDDASAASWRSTCTATGPTPRSSGWTRPGSMYHPRVSHEQIERGAAVPGDGRQGGVPARRGADAGVGARGARRDRARAPADLKLLVAHQANLRIAEMMQKALGLRDDQVYNNIMWYGNTTAATIPIALDECVRAGRITRETWWR